MTTAATSLLGLGLPVTGELSGTWGDTVNNQITSLLDSAVAGTTSLSTDADVTLTTTTLAANQARQAILLCTGARTALRTITAPAQSKVYTVINSTTGGFSVKVVGVGPTTGVTILAGESVTIAWNGSDFVKVSNQGGAGVFTSVTDSSLTSGRVPYASTGGLLADSANLTFNGTTLTVNTLSVSGVTNFTGAAFEAGTISATAATGTINYDVLTQTVLYYTTNASANFTVNIRGNGSNTLNSIMSTNQVMTVAFLCTNGATAYYNNAVTIDGSSVTPKWQGGSAPSAGNASSIDVYVYTVIKTAASTYTVLASQTRFA